jgi:thiamine-monophosphate kinase
MLEDKDHDFTPISRLGEFGLIDRVTKGFRQNHPSLIKGVGDDAAVYSVNQDEVHVVSTDMLVEGVHFDLSYVPLQHLGYKSVVVNLSDIYAMNAEPFGITVSLAMSSRFTVEAVEAFYEGVRLACENYGVDLLGGDTSSSRGGLIVSITAVGRGKRNEIAYRNGAKENDLVVVSGDLGSAFAGLQVLEREKSVFMKNPEVQPDLSGMDYVVGRQLRPEAKREIVRKLKQMGIKPTSMIDISDGLGSELMHICNQSLVGATIYETKLMIDPVTVQVGERFEISPLSMALNGGEDYELLFTVPLEAYDKMKDWSEVSIIGHISDRANGVNVVTASGSILEVNSLGFNHFRDGNS